MKKQLWYTLLAMLTASPAVLVNRALALRGEDWLATATVRYCWAVIMLGVVVRLQFGPTAAKQMIVLFRQHQNFWILWCVINGPLLYVSCVYLTTQAPAWVVSTLWNCNLPVAIAVMSVFRQPLSKRSTFPLITMFFGVVMISVDHVRAVGGEWHELFRLWPVLIVLVLEALGDQLYQDASTARKNRVTWIPAINEGIGKSIHAWLLILYAMAIPQMVVWQMFHLAMPTWVQVRYTGIVVFFTVVVSSYFWALARGEAGTSSHRFGLLHASPAVGIVVTLIGEVVLLQAPWPGSLGLWGMIAIAVGFFIYLRSP